MFEKDISGPVKEYQKTLNKFSRRDGCLTTADQMFGWLDIPGLWSLVWDPIEIGMFLPSRGLQNNRSNDQESKFHTKRKHPL
jgi:hypothetical protein